MKKGLRLWTLLSIIFVATLLITNTILYGLILYQDAQMVQKKEEDLLLAVGQQLAIEPGVLQVLNEDTPSDTVEEYTKEVAAIHGLDFIVVMNMEGIRLTHPDESQIGQPFKGGDEAPALQGKNHISISEGTLGTSLRGFVPVYEGNQQIGVIALGIRLDSLSTLVENSRSRYTIALIVSVGAGLIVALLVAYYLKKQLLNLEPREISSLLEERNAMLNETKDAVVVVNTEGIVTLANIAANDMYQQLTNQPTDLAGQPISQLLQDTKQIDFERSVEQLYRQNGQDYLFSAAPIMVNKRRIGSIVFLRNATESLFVTDQLANTTAYATALQSQSHEFMNKLHVIYGLVDLEAYNELKIYLSDILQPEKEFSHRLSILVRNPMLAGFFIGEREKFAERKTQLLIEIAPEIPEAADQEQTTTIINIYRYIHHALLQRWLPEELAMSIEYRNQQLTTTYRLALKEEKSDSLELVFKENYFQQLLKDADGEFRLETIENQLIIHVTTAYEGSPT